MEEGKVEAGTLNKLRRSQLARKVAGAFAVVALSVISLLSVLPSVAPATLGLLFSCFAGDADRAVIFVVCNAILLFLVKDSGLMVHARPSTDDHRNYDDITITEGRASSTEGGSPEGAVLDDEAVEEVAERPQKEGEGEEVDEALMELNRMFDEFIEKFKRERKLEAMQIVVA